MAGRGEAAHVPTDFREDRQRRQPAQAAESGSANWKKVLGALKAGQLTSAKVPQGKNCRVDLRGKYADGKSADVSNVDICADKSVNLTKAVSRARS